MSESTLEAPLDHDFLKEEPLKDKFWDIIRGQEAPVVSDDALADALETDDSWKKSAWRPAAFPGAEAITAPDAPAERLLEAGEPEPLLEASLDPAMKRLEDAVNRSDYMDMTQPDAPIEDEDGLIERAFTPSTPVEAPLRKFGIARVAARAADTYHDEPAEQAATPERAESLVDNYDELFQKAVELVHARKAAAARGEATSESAIGDFETFQELCKQAEAAGVSQKSLDLIGEFFALGYDAQGKAETVSAEASVAAENLAPSPLEMPISIKTTTGEISVVNTSPVTISTEPQPIVGPLDQEPSELDGIDEVHHTGQVSVSAALDKLEGPAHELPDDQTILNRLRAPSMDLRGGGEVRPTTLERLKGWWGKNRESVKEWARPSYWGDKWAGAVLNPYYQLSGNHTTALEMRRTANEIKLADMDEDERARYKDKRRAAFILGTMAFAAYEIAGVTSGLHSGSSEAIVAVAGGAVAHHAAEAAPHIAHVAGHAAELFSPAPGSFTIKSGEGGIELFDKLGLKSSDWSSVKGDLIKRFPGQFYNAGGDIRINHTGKLPKAVQQYITDRFKG